MAEVVHVTEITAFKQCRQYWDFSYRQGLVPLETGYGPMWFGIGVHVALATYYKHGMSPVVAFERWFKAQVDPVYQDLDETTRTKLDNFHLLGLVMMRGYIPWAEKNDQWEVIAIEEELQYEISPGQVIAGTQDLLVRKDGKLWVVDHKTCAAFVDPDALEFDDQMVKYLWLVMKVYNEVPGGALYSMLRKKVPADPYVLKAGGLSKAKDIDTTHEIYLDKIHELGLDPDDYTDILERLKSNEYYRREKVMRTRRELQIFDEQVKAEVAEITRPNVPIFPTMTQDCLWSCTYKDLCRTRLTGGDVAYATNVHFKVIRDYQTRWLERHPREGVEV